MTIPWSLILKLGIPLALIAAIVVQHFLLTAADSRNDVLRSQNITLATELEHAKQVNVTLETAAAERAADTADLDTMKEDLTHAIESAPKGIAPSAATVALGCARLRRQGNTSSTSFAAICGGR